MIGIHTGMDAEERMNEMICPSCGKRVMSFRKAESILRKTTSKILLNHCLCGETLEIRSPTKYVFEISTPSGKKLEQFKETGREYYENDSLRG